MAQSSYTIVNAAGAATRAAINSVLEAIQSANSGEDEPASPAAGQPWLDTSDSGQARYRVRDAANDSWDELLDGDLWPARVKRAAADPADGDLEQGQLLMNTASSTLWMGTGTDSDDAAVEVGAAAGGSSLPAGVILLWSGAVAEIPDGWALCDGSSGTPDLRQRFVVGAGGGRTADYEVGDTGGATSISEVPEHHHSVNLATSEALAGIDGVGGGGDGDAGPSNIVDGTPLAHTHTVTGDTDDTGVSEVEVLPPYYALCYIQKT